jgi:hypothetical protein
VLAAGDGRHRTRALPATQGGDGGDGSDGGGTQRAARGGSLWCCGCHLDSCNSFVARQTLNKALAHTQSTKIKKVTRKRFSRHSSHVTWCFIKYAHTAHADLPLPLLQCTYLCKRRL